MTTPGAHWKSINLDDYVDPNIESQDLIFTQSEGSFDTQAFLQSVFHSQIKSKENTHTEQDMVSLFVLIFKYCR